MSSLPVPLTVYADSAAGITAVTATAPVTAVYVAAASGGTAGGGDAPVAATYPNSATGTAALSGTATADRIAGTDPDYATRDLYNAIGRGECPSWTLYVQVMTFQQAETCAFNPFDLTKVTLKNLYMK